jgi:hypothetical protein
MQRFEPGADVKAIAQRLLRMRKQEAASSFFN